MKITEEWIDEQIAKCDKNIEFFKRRQSDFAESWQEMIINEEGVKECFKKVRSYKRKNNYHCVIFDKVSYKCKKHIVRILKHFCKWLEWTENTKNPEMDVTEMIEYKENKN